MVSVSKLSRALVNTACYRGRKRVSRLAILLLVMGILVVGLRQVYVELSQQNVEDVVKKKSLQSVGGDAPGRGELMTKNIKEHHDAVRQVDDVIKGGVADEQEIAAVRHQDTGESHDSDYQERDNMENQVNEVVQDNNVEYQDKDYDHHGDNNNHGDAYENNEKVEGEDKNDNHYEQEAYQDGVEDQDGVEYPDGVEVQDVLEDGLGQDGKEGENQDDDFSDEMAKLDLMEKNRNARVLSKDSEGANGNDENADEAEIEENEGDHVPPAGAEEEEEDKEYQYDDQAQNEDKAQGDDVNVKTGEDKKVEEVSKGGAAGDDGEGNVHDAGDAGEGDAGEAGDAGDAGEAGEGDKAAEREAELKEQRRMTAEEVAAAIRSGEMCKSVCPPFVWSDWSPCSKACGRGRRYRKAIYEFVCQSSDLCPLNRIEESICETPCKFDPDKYGGPDGLDLYPINPLNPAIFPEDRNYMCGHWLVEYEKIHKEIIEGKRPPAYLVYSTGKGEYPTAGGLSGRIKGITTVFFMAVLLERAFLIEWQDPVGLEDYLVPKSFNWADFSPLQHLTRGKPHDIGSWKAAKENGKSSQWYMDEDFSSYFKNPVEVIQGPRYDYTYAILRNPGLMPKAYELGIDRVKCRVCCAWDMLFKMVPNFEDEMNKLMRSLGHPVRPVVAVQARVKSDDVQKSVTDVEHYLNCAQKATKELKYKTPIYIPILNNRLVVHMLQKKYFRIMKTPIEIETATRTVHTHLGNLPADTEEDVVFGVQERTFKEFFLMLNSTLLVRAKGYLGSFGNVADAIRRHYGKPGTVHTYTSGGSACAVFPDGSKIE